MMKVDYDVAMEIASHEAIIRQAYKDSVGVWTWSVGLTAATGHNVTRYIGRPQPLEDCLRVYVWALDKYADAVRRAFAGHNLTKAQFAGALSFHWNTGAIGRASWVKHWKAGNIAGARSAFMQWNKPPEILGRRRKERDLFFDGKWSHNGFMTEYTRLTSKSTPVWSSAKRINVERELRRVLGGDPIIKPPPNPKPAGDDTVRAYQRRLIALGYDLGPAGADGIVGVRTRNALRQLQRSEGIADDGRWGPETSVALAAAEARAKKQPDDPGLIVKPAPEIGPAPADWLVRLLRWLFGGMS